MPAPAPAAAAASPPASGSPSGTLVLVLAHAAFWTLAGTLYGMGRAVHPDMLEVYSLGQEPAFGYALHPPLVPWIAAAWFQVMPHVNAAYFLLAALTSAIGLTGIAALAGRLDRSETMAETAVLLHALLPFHGLMALVFNHNTVHLALWPWTAYWLLRAIDTRTLTAGAVLGALAGLCLLAKYFAAVLFAALLLAALLHPKAQRFLASASFLTALATAAAVVGPHAAWLLQHGPTPFDHAIAQTSREWLVTIREALLVTAYVMAVYLPALAVLAAALGRARLRESAAGLLATPERRAITALAIAPIAITVLIGFSGLAKISIVFTTPCFFLTPFALIAPLTATELERSRQFARSSAVLAAPLLLAAITLFPITVMSTGWSKAWDAKPELAAAAIAQWRAELPGEPALVAGMAGYSDAIGFYSAPRAKIVRSFRSLADAEAASNRLAATGGMIVCEDNQAPCLDAMAALGLPNTIRREFAVAARLLWLSGPQLRFSVLMIPPPPAPRP